MLPAGQNAARAGAPVPWPSLVLCAGVHYDLVKRAGHREREPDGELAAAKEFRDPGGMGR
jgi:hypothetical protein